jgi:hypothetical protein
LVFPIITIAALGSDLPSLWALQGLFLFVVVVVCGANFSIERFYSVNLALMVLGIATIAVTVAAPIHAIYRNTHPFIEGRNFYRGSVAGLMKRWHEVSDGPLPLVSGGDALAFAAAFYGPDHPEYRAAWNPQDTPSRAIVKRGWGALCFSDDEGCIAFLVRSEARSRSVQSEFNVQSVLLGWPGATRLVTALIVPPDNKQK